MLLSNHSDEVILFLGGFTGIAFFLLVILWIYNKKKFNNLKHAIPADVVKNYLDSIIQNSTALKSSLVRGGDLRVQDGVPSVMPVGHLSGGESLGVSQGSSSQNEAELAALRSQLEEKNSQIGDLDGQCKNCDEKLKQANQKIADLEAKLGDSGSAVDSGALDELTKERDQLKERLQEYAIIEDDLANLKRLQQENEQLKKSLDAMGGGSQPSEQPQEVSGGSQAQQPEPVQDEPAAAPPEPEAEDEQIPATAGQANEPVMEAEAEQEEQEGEVPPEEEKSPDDLLSEFEKMLS